MWYSFVFLLLLYDVHCTYYNIIRNESLSKVSVKKYCTHYGTNIVINSYPNETNRTFIFLNKGQTSKPQNTLKYII